MIEPQLSHYPFLMPGQYTPPGLGYITRQQYCRQLQQDAVIGRYDARGNFTADATLKRCYRNEIPLIAQALTQTPRHSEYRKYKVASIHKGSLVVHLEWLLAQHLGQHTISFEHLELLRRGLGVQPLLIDMGGPSYELLWPETLQTAMQNECSLEPTDMPASLHQMPIPNRSTDRYGVTAIASGF